MNVSKRIWIQTAVATVAILINLFAPQFAENTRYLLLALVILFIGMRMERSIIILMEIWKVGILIRSTNGFMVGIYLPLLCIP